MIFCETCRVLKQWPRSSCYPLVGVTLNSKCEICGKLGEQHDIPALYLVPESSRTKEQKLIFRAMQDAYQQKAEGLIAAHVSGTEAGKINHPLTDLMRGMVAEVNGEIDWYVTYCLRLAAQQGYQKDEEVKRDRRKYAL